MTQSQEEKTLDKIRFRRDRIEKWEETDCDECETLIICYGGTARAVASAVEESKRQIFLRVGVFRPITVWPFPDRALLKIIRDNKHLRQIVVCEHNDGQMLLEVQPGRRRQSACRFPQENPMVRPSRRQKFLQNQGGVLICRVN